MSDRETHSRWDQMASLTAGHCPMCLLEENERLRAEINLRKRIIDGFPFCSDHRDKQHGKDCLACRIDAALALHKPDEHGFCEVCYGASNWERYPCPTVKVLKGGA